jgi:uncharacterized protein YndB with AHSA1/START domain
MPSVRTEDRVSREVSITRLFDAPRELVFRCFTDAEHIATWWGPEGFTAPECASDPRPGGKLRIVMRGPDGAEFPVDATYLEVEAPTRLVIESNAVGPDGAVLLEAINTVTLVERDGATEVTVHARATALVSEAAAMLVGMDAGWTQSLQCLDDVLTGAVDRQFVIMRVFDAPRQVVFRAWTDPEQLLHWWGPKGFSLTIDEIDVRPGGTWRFTMHGPDGVDYPNVSRYEVVDAPRRLVFMHSGEGVTAEDPAFRSTVTFDDMGGTTVLTMRAVFETAAARDLVQEKYHALEGGNETLDRLGEYLDTR